MPTLIFGIPEYWIVDLQRRVIEVHRSPSEPGYDEVEKLPGTGRVAPLAFPDAELAVADILGPPPAH